MSILCLVAVRKKSLMNNILKNLLAVSGSRMDSVDSEAGTLDELIGEIKSSRADVVVIEKSSPFAGNDALVCLLALFVKMVLIIVSEDSNRFSVIRKEEVLLATSSDLVNFISSI